MLDFHTRHIREHKLATPAVDEEQVIA